MVRRLDSFQSDVDITADHESLEAADGSLVDMMSSMTALLAFEPTVMAVSFPHLQCGHACY